MNSSGEKIEVAVHVIPSNISNKNSNSSLLTCSQDVKEVNVKIGEHLVKTFHADQVFTDTSQAEKYSTFGKCIAKDLMKGTNCLLILCNLPVKDANYASEDEMLKNVSSQVLNGLLTNLVIEMSSDVSLHVSGIAISNDKEFDLCQKQDPVKNDLKTWQYLNERIEIENLIDKPISNEKEIDEFLELVISRRSEIGGNNTCVHMILFGSVVRKSTNFDGLESINVGYLNLIVVGSCVHILTDYISLLQSQNIRRTSFPLRKTANVATGTTCSWGGKLSRFLKSSLGNFKMCIFFTLPSVLHNLPEDLDVMDTIFQARNVCTSPEITEKLILRESLKEYAEQIKTLEKDILATQKNSGITINQLKYRALGNKLIMTEEQLKELHCERKAIIDKVKNKQQIMLRLQGDFNSIEAKIEEEKHELEMLENDYTSTQLKKNAMCQTRMTKAEECVLVKNSLSSCISDAKVQQSQLLKFNALHKKSTLNIKLSADEIDHLTNSIQFENAKVKEITESLLLHLKKISSDTDMLQRNFSTKVNEVYENFNSLLKFWKHLSSSLISEFQEFLEESSQSCNLLKHKLCSELFPINSSQDKIIDVLNQNKIAMMTMITSYSNKMQISVDASIKLLLEILYTLDMLLVKLKEQLKALANTTGCYSKDRTQFLHRLSSSMKSVHQYFDKQLQASLGIKSSVVSHHTKIKMHADEEFAKIKDAIVSLRNIFNNQRSFSHDKWHQRQTELIGMKQMSENSSRYFNQCNYEDPKSLEKFRQQSMLNIKALNSKLKDQTGNLTNMSDQLVSLNDQIKCNIKNCFEDNRKMMERQKNEVKSCIKEEESSTMKCMKNAQSLIETSAQCMFMKLQNVRNSTLIAPKTVKILEEKQDANLAILPEKTLKKYIVCCNDALAKTESCLQQLPQTSKDGSHSETGYFEFNFGEFDSSTPTTPLKRPTCTMMEKIKLLNRLKTVAAVEIAKENQNDNVDVEPKKNLSVMSLPNMGVKAKVETESKRSFINRKVAK